MRGKVAKAGVRTVHIVRWDEHMVYGGRVL